MITKTCLVSGKKFIITDEDLLFYKKMGTSVPTLCPEERQRRRLSWRNERTLHRRQCTGTNKPILSIYAADYVGPVYAPEKYWSDDWDGREYGREFDFTREFFPQFMELYHQVPQIARQITLTENCDYVNDVLRLKNCYLVFDGEKGQDCLYGETFVQTTDCMDFLFLDQSELCYECINCENGYQLLFAQNCTNCQESWFLKNCVGCKNCFGCLGIHNKQYWIYNKPHSKKEYEMFMSQFDSGKYSVISELRIQAQEAWRSGIVKNISGKQNENCTGDYLNQSKDCFDCYDCKKLRDCKFCSNILMGAQDCYDVNLWGDNLSLCCDCATVGEGIQNIIASFWVGMGGENIAHSTFCVNNCKNLLGCSSLQKSEHCILNKSYTKHEYETLKVKIVAHMKETGEWGEFFPAELSPFAYNKTVAHEYFPMTKEECSQRGYKWRDESRTFSSIDPVSIPDNISDIDDSILKETLVCENTGKPYRLVKPELQFYQKMNLPIPRLHPDERHRERMALRNLRKLYDRECADCQKPIATTYAPEGSEKVLCDECYLKVVD